MLAPIRILTIKLRSLGDTVLMTAPLVELIQMFPQAEIHLLVAEGWAPLFEGFPKIQKIWAYEHGKISLARSRSLARLAYNLRKQKYDCVLNFHASPSSALLAFSTGALIRSIHFHGHQHKDRFSTLTIPGKGTLKPIIERDMDTLRALGFHVPAGRSPKVFLQPSEKQEANFYFKKLGLTSPILGMSLGASRLTKTWPVSRFAALAIEWCIKTSGSTYAIAGPMEVNLIEEFLLQIDQQLSQINIEKEKRAEIRGKIAATYQLSLRKLSAILAHLAVLVGNDSGPRHLAVAVETPTVTLFGPEHPFEWHPYPRDRHPYLFIDSLPCRQDADPGMPSWCGLKECIIEEHRCMRQIGVDQVLFNCLQVARREEKAVIL